MAGKKITELISGSLLNLPLSGVTTVVYSGTTFQHEISDLREKLVDSGSHNFTGSQHINGDLTITGSLLISGSAIVVGSVTGSFNGDGSGLTGITTTLPSGVISGSQQIVDLGFNTTGSNTFIGDQTISGSLIISGNGTLNDSYIVSSNTINKIETITSASYVSITPISGTLYIIID
jgi:hypothetical protein